jgi:hypothetical protein
MRSTGPANTIARRLSTLSKQFSGPLLTLAFIFLSVFLSRTPFSFASIPAIFILPIGYATFREGRLSGLLSAALAWGYTAYFLSAQNLSSQEILWQLTFWATLMLATILLGNWLQRREKGYEGQKSEARNVQRQFWLERVLELSKQITQINNLQECLYEIFEGVRNGLAFDRVGFFLYDLDAKVVRGVYGTSKNGEREDTSWFVEPLGESGIFRDGLSSSNWHVYFPDYSVIRPDLKPGDDAYGVKEHAAVSAWAGDTPVAVFWVDNFISKRPMHEEQLEALRLFASYAGLAIQKARLYEAAQIEISDRTRAENALQQSHENMTWFMEKLVTLQETTNHLSKAKSFDVLCRLAVEWAHTRLGFQRVGIWVKTADGEFINGTFGVDEQGEVRDEREVQLPIELDDETWRAIHKNELVYVSDDAPLYNDRHEQVGRGPIATAGLWDGDDIIGFMCTDNLISGGTSFTSQQRELLGLYASALGHLFSRN